ncbi:NADP-dependent oxidoreductase [Limisalsivibrio acetivorans]|uniref:NADP-dependent oxidoreductase n=1 Tax=Limisalsivibrio acetivorans TaxID=1304888 RepID=UPI0003B40615|nr:NADP-dependent oxidoreductase [Limisalsivibrio acetivorans]
MKAVIIREFGGAEVLETAEMDKPAPGEYEVLVKIAGAGVNPVDAKTRRGSGFVAEMIKDSLPWIPGFDISGTVEEIGTGVRELKVGDKVYGRIGFSATSGTYAEYAAVNEDELSFAPSNIELYEAAGIPVAALTAWQAFHDAAHLEKGSSVLIHAGAGGVGHFAVQFAKLYGAEVTCTASEHNRDFLLSLGADRVIDYKSEDFTRVMDGADFILDTMGGEIGIRSMDILRKCGVMVTVPTITAEEICRKGLDRSLDVRGIKVKPSRDNLDTIRELIENGKVKVHVSRVFGLDEAAEAHRLIESGHSKGKCVLKIA